MEISLQDRLSDFLRSPAPDAHQFVWSVPAARRAELLLAVSARYRAVCSQESGESPVSEHRLAQLLAQIYLAGVDLSERESFELLRTSFHRCGHGVDVQPPLDLALGHFRDRQYSADFFDAARAYRQSLEGLASVQARNTARKLDVILWQDLRHPSNPWSCFTGAIQRSLSQVEEPELSGWRKLLQKSLVNDKPEPGKTWEADALPCMAALGCTEFAARMQAWLTAGRVEPVRLETAGSHILKNLIWYAALVRQPALDDALVDMIDWRWDRRANAIKIFLAVAYLLTLRSPDYAGPQIERIYRKHGIGLNDGYLGKAYQTIRKSGRK